MNACCCGSLPHAAVIVWPDIVSIRPAFRAMGKRLAESGYSVLVVNPYYRTARGAVVPEGKTFQDPGIRELLMPHARSLSPETCVTDGRAFVEYLDSQPSVDTNRKIGTTGYCMTGSYTMRLAAAIPDRIGAGGSFHGGGLASKPRSKSTKAHYTDGAHRTPRFIMKHRQNGHGADCSHYSSASCRKGTDNLTAADR